MNSSPTDDFDCFFKNAFICSFKASSSKYEKINAILSLTYFVIASTILITNSIVLFIFVRNRNRFFASITKFARYSLLLMLVFNIFGSVLSYLASVEFCYNLSSNYYFCLIKCCLVYLIGFMMTIVQVLLALERFISIKWMHHYKVFLRKKYLFIVNIFLTLIGIFVTFSPIIFVWNRYTTACDCGLNSLPTTYILGLNTMFFIFACLTILAYVYIYLFVKKRRLKITATFQYPVSMAKPDLNTNKIKKTPCTDKTQILLSQVILFSIFFSAWFPFVFMTTYEAVNNITSSGVESSIRNGALTLILISCVLSPLIYICRLKKVLR